MAIDTTQPRTRRALLGAGLGALAATVASVLRSPGVTDAGSPPVLLGLTNTATTPTKITANGTTAIWGNSPRGRGIYGSSRTNVGVTGSSGSHIGVWGSSDSSDGVLGTSGSGNGVVGRSTGNVASGVYGENTHQGYGAAGRSNAPPLGTNGLYGAATLGDNTADGVGVWGVSAHGIGVFADAANPDAVAFKANGVTQFARAGRLSIAVGNSSVSPFFGVRIDPGTLVLATLQQNHPGIWIQSAVPDPAGNTFTITLNTAVTGLVPMKVAWFLVN